jgi:[protein-PII] uridylyltransferase
MGLSADDIAAVTDLVRHHLLLPDTATRRDLDDPATVAIVTSAITDLSRLELLHALTVADAAATGPAAWSDWKAGLVAELVRRASVVIAGQAPPPSDPLSEPPTAPLTEPQRRLAAAGELAVELDGSILTIVAPDRPGLLWRWAAVAALHRLIIHAATAASAESSTGPMAVTCLEVVPRFGSLPDLDALGGDIRQAYDDPSRLEHRLAEREQTYASTAAPAAPPLVLWFDDESQAATIVEVRAHDTVGLLYRLTRVLADAGLDVRSARIQTLGAEVVDAFYVVDGSGATVEDAAIREQLEAALLAAC